MNATFAIANRPIGPMHRPYVIAEMSANHGQRYEDAVALVYAAKEAGADALKLQTYTADTLTLDSQLPGFQIGKGTIWEGRNLHQLYRECHTPWEWQPKLKALAESLGMHCFSSPFDATAVDFLERLDVPAHKVASFELVDIPLLKKVASTGKPVILSTGMASLAEIDEAVQTLRGAGTTHLALLKCSSAYPALPEQMNLRTLPHLSQVFDTPVGLSDHTLGIATVVAAVAMGACIIEKHLTLSRSVPGPDASFSLEPAEFKAMTQAVLVAWQALGRVSFELSSEERASLAFRRSLYVVKAVAAGELFTLDNVRSIRPGDGLHTRHLSELLGRRAARDLKAGTPMDWSLLQ